ncbi:hypothetical protein PQ077_00700 [Litorivicinus sp.]|nr:hypothetical protein [Litorivicinus sp.]
MTSIVPRLFDEAEFLDILILLALHGESGKIRTSASEGFDRSSARMSKAAEIQTVCEHMP